MQVGDLIPIGGSGNAQPSDLLEGKTASTDAGDIVGTMPNKVGSNTIITPSLAAQTIPKGYYGGSVNDGKVNPFTVDAGNEDIIYGVIQSAGNSTSYVKVIETIANYGGTYRVSFLIRSNGSSDGYALIYVNGSPRGTERSANTYSSTIFTEDITVNPGQKIQVYCKSGGSDYWILENFTVGISVLPIKLTLQNYK